jgi:RNA polymerase sigma-70 factor (ECF subfamily)
MRAYLNKIAFRLIIDKKRRIKVERSAFEREKSAAKGKVKKQSHEEDILTSLEMDKTFGSLKPRERILLWLAYVEGYSYREIAEVTDSKEKSVKVQLYRARKELAGLWQQKENIRSAEP